MFVRRSCSLLFPVLLTNLFWTVTMIKGKHSSFSACFACTHACGHYLGVTSTCGSTPPRQSSEPEYRCVSPEAATPDTQWRHQCQEVFLATERLKGTLGSVVTLMRLPCLCSLNSAGLQFCYQSTLHPITHRSETVSLFFR